MFKIRKTAALAALFCSSVLNAWASADHMVIAMPQIPTIIEPQGINNNAIDRYVGNVFETLLKADQKTGELKPGLAESWRRLSPDTVEVNPPRPIINWTGLPCLLPARTAWAQIAGKLRNLRSHGAQLRVNPNESVQGACDPLGT